MGTGSLAVLLASAIAATSGHSAVEERLQAIVAQASDGERSPGCALAVYRDGDQDGLFVSGQADLEDGRPIDSDTLFYAASVSKQFTALAIAQLADSGRLTLDDPVQTHIPELPRYRHPVTIRMLLQHSAGIRDSLALLRLSGRERNSAEARDQALSLLLEQQDTNFPPGTATGYSNGGYLLLAEIVERVAGERFPDYVRTAILEPIGMRDSFVLDGARPRSPQLAHGYVRERNAFERRDTYPLFGGSGGVMLTLGDLARYEHDIEHGHRVWTPSVRRIMLQPGVLADGSPAIRKETGLALASGLMLGERNGHRLVQHGGGAEAFRHMYARVPDRRMAVAVFCNRSDVSAQEMVDEAFDVLLAPPAQYVSDAPVPGRYRSDELQAQYLIETHGDMLRLAAIPDDATAPVAAFTLRRTAHGSYEGEGLTLQPREDRNGFTLDSARARGFRFHRMGDAETAP